MPVSISPITVVSGGSVTLDYQGGRPHDVVTLTFRALADGAAAGSTELHNMGATFKQTLPAPTKVGVYVLEIYQDGGLADKTNQFTVTAAAAGSGSGSGSTDTTSAVSGITSWLTSKTGQKALIQGVANGVILGGGALVYLLLTGRRR